MAVRYLKAFVDDECGATAIEYGLLAALIAVAIIGAVTAFGGAMSNMFNYISDTAGGAMEATG